MLFVKSVSILLLLGITTPATVDPSTTAVNIEPALHLDSQIDAPTGIDNASSEAVNPVNPVIANFAAVISAFKSRDKTKIAAVIAYPFMLPKPLQSIINEQDMLNRFDLVFDEAIIDKIANSSLKDWETVGWRGVMLDNGQVWGTEDGLLKYVAKKTDAKKRALIDAYKLEQSRLHPSLAQYRRPILSWNSARFNVRIDDMGDAGYRYAVWPGHKFQDDEPDMVLYNGSVVYDGSANLASYTFNNGKYEYHVFEFPESPSIGRLMVHHDGKTLVDLAFEQSGPKFSNNVIEAETTSPSRIEIAQDIAQRLKLKAKLDDLASGPIAFEYLRYDRGNGTTLGELTPLPLSKLNDVIEFTVSIDNQGWSYEPGQSPVPTPTTEQKKFSLATELTYWSNYDLAKNYNCHNPFNPSDIPELCQLSEQDNPIYIFGGGASESIALFFENHNGIDKLVRFQYLSEDPG
jgi:hypothetical protein